MYRLFIFFCLMGLLACTSQPLPNADVPNKAKDSLALSKNNETEADSSRLHFVGLWINEGELTELRLTEPDSCFLKYFNPETDTFVELKGQWSVKDQQLYIAWEKAFWGRMQSTYSYKKTDSQELLFQQFEDMEEQMAFYRSE